MDRANIVRNSNGAFKQQPCPAATRRLRQQLPRQRYLTYNICLNHDVVRLHKPVPEPEHGALYSSQAATMEMDVCEHEEACVHVYLRICVCVRCTLVPFTCTVDQKFVEKRLVDFLYKYAGIWHSFYICGTLLWKEISAGSRFLIQIERCLKNFR